MGDWQSLRETHERIRWARLNRTQFVRMIDAAQSLGVKPGTYRTWEFSKADGGRIPPLSELQRIAVKFNVPWQWLATGDGSPDQAPSNELHVVAQQLTARIAQLPVEFRPAALTAVEGVLEAFARKAG